MSMIFLVSSRVQTLLFPDGSGEDEDETALPLPKRGLMWNPFVVLDSWVNTVGEKSFDVFMMSATNLFKPKRILNYCYKKKDGSCCPEKFLHSCNPGLAKTSLRFSLDTLSPPLPLLLFFAYLTLSSFSGMWTTTAPSSCRSSSRRSRPRSARSSRTTSTLPWGKWRQSWW